MRFRTTLLVTMAWCAGCSPASDDATTPNVITIQDLGTPAIAAPRTTRVLALSVRVPQTGFITDFYYPESSVDSEKYPLICFLQGAEVRSADYSLFASRVAAYGFIVAVPDHDTLIGRLADISVIAKTQAYVSLENADDDSQLFDLLDATRLGIGGHSFGGVAALDAMQGVCRFPFCRGTFDTLDTLAAVSLYGTNQCGPAACEEGPITNGTVAVQLIQGTLDGLAELPDAESAFGQIQNAPAQLVRVMGANHYGLTDTNNPSGAAADPTTPELGQQGAIEIVARWTGMFYRAHLLGDPEAVAYITGSGQKDDQLVEISDAE